MFKKLIVSGTDAGGFPYFLTVLDIRSNKNLTELFFVPFTSVELPRNQLVQPEEESNWIIYGPKYKETRTTLPAEQLSLV